MNLSGLTPLIAFTAVALAAGSMYLLLAEIVGAVAGLLRRFRSSRPVSCRPGELVHQALKITGRRWDQYRTATLLFCVSLMLLLVFGRRDWWPDLSTGIYMIIGIVLSLVLAFVAARLFRLVRYRTRLAKLLGAHIDVAQRLTEAQLRGNRIYHAVPVGDGVIDNVVVGANGVYTISLVVPPARRCETVVFERRGLVFQPGDLRRDLREYGRSIVALTRALSECVGESILVQPVIVVPDCRIEEAGDEGPLIVSIESCASFLGWKDRRAYLMEDEMATINDWLSRRMLEHQPQSLQKMANCLSAQLEKPAPA